MKTFLLVCALLAGCFMVGCTPTETAQERNLRISRVFDMNLRELVEDHDRVMLFERNQPGNLWSPHVGF